MEAYENLRWEPRQRLKSIEATLLWQGRVVRRDIVNLFCVNTIQAARDFAKYNELFPGNIVYDRYKKAYVPSESFSPKLVKGTAEDFLELLKLSPSEGRANISFLSNLPSAEILSLRLRKFDSATLQRVNQAICNKLQMKILYQSMSNDESKEQCISPHTLVYNGFRWHIRAYSENHNTFHDFLLARIQQIHDVSGNAVFKIDEDQLWNKLVTVRIAPHPELTLFQKRVIESDYGMEDGEYMQEIRAALVNYFIQLMRVGNNDLAQEPKKQQIYLVNKDELKPYIF